MNVARIMLAAAALSLGVTFTQGQVSARSLDDVHPHVGGAWAPGTIPADGPASLGRGRRRYGPI